jgi:hypothetical protein
MKYVKFDRFRPIPPDFRHMAPVILGCLEKRAKKGLRIVPLEFPSCKHVKFDR